MKSAFGFLAAAAVVLGIIFLAVIAVNSYPHSSPGVTIIGSNLAHLPEGDTLVFLHPQGKSTRVWELTYDGHSVTMNETGWFGGKTVVSVPGTEYMGWFQGTFTFTADGSAVDVAWPDGWDYRS